MGAGRPTKYDPAFCQQVLEMGKEGASKVEMAGRLDIAYSNFDRWCSEHDEFQEAVKQAVRFSQAWWEQKGREATFGGVPGFNATSYIFNMKNRFKDDWRDKVETDHTSSDGSMTPTTVVLAGVDPSDELDG